MSRGDKKTQFGPCVPIWIKETVVSMGKHRNLPMGDMARALVMEAQRHVNVIDQLSVFFWRSLRRGDTIWPGHDHRADIRTLIDFPYDKCERLKFRLTPDDRHLVDDLLMALACPVDHMMAALLIISVQDRRVVRAVAPHFTPCSRYSIERRVPKWHGSSARY
ncbi:hypothetical protein [Alicyclobacillus fastidiosus]|uniref:Uncharacterized protein n=1 Tax=Alicyclobacillus fastidiosus TaxID=392011 RepID=A0ABV5AH94_9BACL|nr:hypothetical protein [Alicyclobacillus fastidiosus]WEH08161.1 hypothetical protein PYS47_15760 [Alicyclobacillus fastidiosus]